VEIVRSHQKAFDSIWRKGLRAQSGPMPADLLYLTSDLRSSSGTGLIADLLTRLIAQRKRERESVCLCVFLDMLFLLNFSVLGIDIHDNYLLVG